MSDPVPGAADPGPGATAVADPSGATPPTGGGDARRWLPIAAIALTIAFAVLVSCARARRGTADFWFDDSWVAISTRVPLSRVTHMGVSALGFTIIVRWWIGLMPASIGWAQSFALGGLVVAPIVVFVSARVAGAPRWAATVVACLTAVNPMLLAESARVKQYTWEYAISAAMVGLAAAVRRDGPTARLTVASAGLVVVAAIFSGSMLIPGALLFGVLGVGLFSGLRRANAPLPARTVGVRLAILGIAGAVILVWSAIYLLHPPAGLTRFWKLNDGFLGSSGSIGHTGRQALDMLRGFLAEFIFGGGTPLLVVPLGVIVWFVARSWRKVWWLLIAPLVAVALSIAQRYPIGTVGRARIDAWLMPWVVVLLALALAEIATTALARGAWDHLPTGARAGVVALVALSFAVVSWKQTTHYPTTHARVALQNITKSRDGALTYVVDADFPIDLVVASPIRIVDDTHSSTGFTVSLRGGLRVLHVNSPSVAGRELHPACGGIARIAGASPSSLAKVLPRVGCPVVDLRVGVRGSSRPWDETVVVRFGPAGG